MYQQESSLDFASYHSDVFNAASTMQTRHLAVLEVAIVAAKTDSERVVAVSREQQVID